MKTPGNMYENVIPWNPLGGECLHRCAYCSTNKWKKRKLNAFINKYSGTPRVYEKELKNLGSGKTYFVCAQNDLFAGNVPFSAIKTIIEHCKKYPNNIYLLQTKNPQRLFDLEFILDPENMVICTTLESNRDYPEITAKQTTPKERASWFVRLGLILYKKYITIEPILDFDLEIFVKMIKDIDPEQVWIGADSGKNRLPEPSKEKVLSLIKELEKFTIVKQKKNIDRLLK